MHEAFARWVLESRVRAIGAAIGLACLCLLLSPAMLFTAWLPGALLALLVFADRPRWAVEAAAWAALPIVVSVALGGRLAGGVALATMMLGPPLAVALLIRRTGSFALGVQVATIGGALLVPLVHLAVADPEGFWRPVLTELERLLRDSGNADPAQVDQVVRTVERILWGTVAWVIVLHAVVGVIVGLWWFGKITGRAELGPRFRELRLGLILAVVAVVLLALVYLGVAREADDMLLVLAGGFLLQALALAHWARGAYGLGKWWLPTVYVGGAILQPLSLFVAAVIGLVDNVIRIRDRPRADTTQKE